MAERLTNTQLQRLFRKAALGRWRTLDLSNCIRVSQVDWVAANLGRLRDHLTHLDLSSNMIGPEGASTIADALAQLPGLTHLNLSQNHIGPVGQSDIALALTHVPDLTHLDLSYNQLRFWVSRGVGSALNAVPGLTHLDLSGNEFDTWQGEWIAREIANVPGLRHLDLSYNDIGPGGVSEIAAALTNVPGLTHLNLSRNNLRGRGASAIAAALKNVPGLTHLNLSLSVMGPQGVLSIAAALRDVPRLTQLDLWSSLIGPEGGSAIAGALRDVRGLTHLDLRFNKIGPEGSLAIAGALGDVPGLTLLNLWGNKIGPAGASAIAHALKHVPGLTHLDLASNKIDREALAELLGVLAGGGVPELESLNLDGNPDLGVDEALARSTDPAAWRAYARAGSRRPLLCAKAMILGEGRIGKSHLAAWTFGDDPDYFEPDREKTHGFEMRPSRRAVANPAKAGKAKVLVRSWDFGGQHHLHATHRFFLTRGRGVFVVVCDPTKQKGENNLRHWMRLIAHEAAGPRSRGTDGKPAAERTPPIIVVRTRGDQLARGTPMRMETDDEIQAIRKEAGLGKGAFFKIIDGVGHDGATPIRPEHLDAVERLIAAIDEGLASIPELWAELPTSWADAFDSVVCAVESDDEPYVSEAEFRSVCEDRGVGADAEPEQYEEELTAAMSVMRDALRDAGVVLDVRGNPTIGNNAAVAGKLYNPAWVQTPVYRVLWSRHSPESGRRTEDELHEIMQTPSENESGDSRLLWKSSERDANTREEIIRIMEACQVSFAVGRDGARAWFVPDVVDHPFTTEIVVPRHAAVGRAEWLPRHVGRRLLGVAATHAGQRELRNVHSNLIEVPLADGGTGVLRIQRDEQERAEVAVWSRDPESGAGRKFVRAVVTEADAAMEDRAETIEWENPDGRPPAADKAEPAVPELITIGKFTVDTVRAKMWYGDEINAVEFGRSEQPRRIIEYLAMCAEKGPAFVPRTEIIEYAWGGIEMKSNEAWRQALYNAKKLLEDVGSSRIEICSDGRGNKAKHRLQVS